MLGLTFSGSPAAGGSRQGAGNQVEQLGGGGATVKCEMSQRCLHRLTTRSYPLLTELENLEKEMASLIDTIP